MLIPLTKVLLVLLVVYRSDSIKRPSPFLEPPDNSANSNGLHLEDEISSKILDIFTNNQKRVSHRNGYNYNKSNDGKIFPPIPNNQYLSPEDTPNSSDHFFDPVTEDYLPPSSTTQEVFVNKNIPEIVNNTGYFYHPPTTPGAPTFADEVPLPPNTYLPSSFVKPHDGEQRNRNPDNKSMIKIEVISMSCVVSTNPDKGFFTVVIASHYLLESTPVIDDSPDSACELTQDISLRIIIDIQQNKFKECGVVSCGKNELCLRLRFPQINGMKLIDDAKLTLKCKEQQRTAARTHVLSTFIHSKDNIQGRSLNHIATGGTNFEFKSQVELYKFEGNKYTTVGIQDAVNLGDHLVLKAQVRKGDGWKFSRLTDVTLFHNDPDSPKSISSASLLDSNGCPRQVMRALCPLPPVSEGDLRHRLSLRAAIFRGMKSGQQILMRITVEGCLEEEDCLQDTSNCLQNIARTKRSSSHLSSPRNRTMLQIDHLSYRVMTPKANNETYNITESFETDKENNDWGKYNEKLYRKMEEFTFIALLSIGGALLLFAILIIVICQMVNCRKLN